MIDPKQQQALSELADKCIALNPQPEPLPFVEPSDRKVFQGVKEASSATGVALELILRARAHPDAPRGSDGFHQSGRIAWHVVGPWIDAHKDELQSVTGETREHWLLRKDRANALLAELELEEKYKRIVPRDAIKELLDRIASAQTSLFNGKLRQELPARLNLKPEQIVEIDKIIQELFGVIQKGMSSWQ